MKRFQDRIASRREGVILNRAEARRWKIILAFGLVYVFWGSTYLGIDIAVQSIPPALMCAVRFAIAGVIMLAVGVLLLMGGNLTLSYAELSVSTGLAALIIAVTPLWFLVLDSMLLGHHRISGGGKAGRGSRWGRRGQAILFSRCWPAISRMYSGRLAASAQLSTWWYAGRGLDIPPTSGC